MSRCSTMVLNGVGLVLVEKTVLTDFPPSDDFWDDLSLVILHYLQEQKDCLNRASSKKYGRHRLQREGIPTADLALHNVLRDAEGRRLLKKKVWAYYLWSSHQGRSLRTIVIIRDSPPDEISRGRCG